MRTMMMAMMMMMKKIRLIIHGKKEVSFGVWFLDFYRKVFGGGIFGLIYVSPYIPSPPPPLPPLDISTLGLLLK